MQTSVEKIAGLSQHLNESRHTPNWKEVEIKGKENNIVKQKFKVLQFCKKRRITF